MTNINTPTQTHWVVHYRDGRPNKVYDNVDDVWAVSVKETDAGRPQPYIQTVHPSANNT